MLWKNDQRVEGFQGQEKTYMASFLVGGNALSYDLETEIDKTYPQNFNPALIESTKAQFMGEIDQYPPVFSALKKEGKCLYEYARKGEQIDIPNRKVKVSNFSIDAMYSPN